MFTQPSPYKKASPNSINQAHFIPASNIIYRRSPGATRMNIPLAESTGPKFINGIPVNSQFMAEDIYSSQVFQPVNYSRKGSPSRFEGISITDQTSNSTYFSNERPYEVIKTEPREPVSVYPKPSSLRPSATLSKLKQDFAKEKQKAEKLMESFEERKKNPGSETKNQSVVSNSSQKHSRNSSKDSINLLQVSNINDLERIEGLYLDFLGEVIQVKDEEKWNAICQDFEGIIQICKQFESSYKRAREVLVKSEAKQKILSEENERLQRNLRERNEEINGLKRKLLEKNSGITSVPPGRMGEVEEMRNENTNLNLRLLERNKEIEIWKEKFFEVEAEMMKNKSLLRSYESKVTNYLNFVISREK